MSFSYTWIEAVAAASVSVVTAFTGIAWWNAPQMNTTFETVLVSPGAFDFEPTGEFVANGAEIDPGDRPVVFRRPIEIMKFQVTLGDYQRCASAGQCEAPDARSTPEAFSVESCRSNTSSEGNNASGPLRATTTSKFRRS